MTTNSLVLELQREAIKSNCIVSDLVRNAYFIAKKLNITDIQEWLTFELNGYSDIRYVPDYRSLPLRVVARTMNGWIPVIIETKLKVIERHKITESIAELEEMLKSEQDVCISFHSDTLSLLCEVTGLRTDFRGFFNKTLFRQILEHVKTKILDWAIELENRGILGEDLMFTEDEKHKANTIINNHFHGNVNQSQIQQSSNNSTQNQLINENNVDLAQVQKLIDEISNLHSNIKFSDKNQSDDFNSKLDTINQELNSTIPNSGKIKSAVLAIKSILEKVSVSVISTGIIHSINSLF